MPITLNISYEQMFDMVMQLTYSERMRLSKEILRQTREESFRKLMLDERPAELDDETVMAECKVARKQIYEHSVVGA